MNIRSFKVFSLLFICFLTSSLVVSAAGKSWEFAGWHGGGCYTNIAFDPKNKGRVYLASDVAGIYRSDDLGDNWYFVTEGLENMLVTQVAIAPSDSQVLYAATKTGVFVSRDAAASWRATDPAAGLLRFIRPDNYRSIAVDSQDPGRVCAGTAKGVLLCSDDFGAQWKNIDPQQQFFNTKKPITVVAFDAEKRIYAAGSTGIIRCTHVVGSCESLGGPQNILDLVLSQKNPGTLYAAGHEALWISSDGGVSWRQSNPVFKGIINRIVIDETGDVPIIRVAWKKGWQGGVILTRDVGQTWEKTKNQMNGDESASPTRIWADPHTRLTGLFMDPLDKQILFRTDGWSVWRSDDGGEVWNEKIVGAPNVVGTHIVFSPDGSLYAASMDNGLLRSSDQGKTYEVLFPKKYDYARSGHVWRVALAGDTIIGTSSPWNDRTNQVIISTDGGKTFDLFREGLPSARPKKNTMWGEGYPRGFAVDPDNPDNIYLGIDGDDGGGLFISNDRGRSWKRSPGQPGSLRIYNALAVDPTNTKRIVWGACAKNGGIYISEDSGQSFEHVFKQSSWIFDVKVASDGTIFAATDSGGPKLFVSSDHGKHWKLAGDFGKKGALVTIAVDPADPKRVAVSSASWGNKAPGRLFFSEDGGKKWREITGDLPDGAGAASMAFDPQGKYLYITRYAGSVYRLEI